MKISKRNGSVTVKGADGKIVGNIPRAAVSGPVPPASLPLATQAGMRASQTRYEPAFDTPPSLAGKKPLTRQKYEDHKMLLQMQAALMGDSEYLERNLKAMDEEYYIVDDVDTDEPQGGTFGQRAKASLRRATSWLR